MKNVLVMVLSADVGIYKQLIQAIRQTWGSKTNQNFNIIYYYGRIPGHIPPPNGVLQTSDTLICDCDECLEYISYKTILAYKYVYNNFKFDYTFRCCCGSYIVPNELMRFVDNKPMEKFYCGVIGDPGSPRQFCSGSGYFLSRDLVKVVVENTSELVSYNSRYNLPGHFDDVCMGMFMTAHGIYPQNGIRNDVPSKIIPGCYHYHFRHEVKYMYEIHKKLGG